MARASRSLAADEGSARAWTGSALQALIGSANRDGFLRRTWDKRPALFRGDWNQLRFCQLTDLETIARLARENAGSLRLTRRTAKGPEDRAFPSRDDARDL